MKLLALAILLAACPPTPPNPSHCTVSFDSYDPTCVLAHPEATRQEQARMIAEWEARHEPACCVGDPLEPGCVCMDAGSEWDFYDAGTATPPAGYSCDRVGNGWECLR